MAVDMVIVGDTVTALAVVTSKFIVYIIYTHIYTYTYMYTYIIKRKKTIRSIKKLNHISTILISGEVNTFMK